MNTRTVGTDTSVVPSVLLVRFLRNNRLSHAQVVQVISTNAAADGGPLAARARSAVTPVVACTYYLL